jgi:hypothetical protein
LSTTRRNRGDIERFGEVLVRSGGEQPLDLPAGGIRADHDHRDARSVRVALQLLEDHIAREVGQVQFEQDQIRAVLAGELDAQTV